MPVKHHFNAQLGIDIRRLDLVQSDLPVSSRKAAPLFLALFLGLFPGLFLFATTTTTTTDEPIGIERRLPWNNDRLSGSPEPPLPYTVEQTFTRHTWLAPIYIAEEPGKDRLWVVQAAKDRNNNDAQIVRIAQDPDSDESEVLLEFDDEITYCVCFHPEYAKNGYVYLFNNGPRGDRERRNQVVRYIVGRAAPDLIDPESRLVILEWRSAGHDGGDLAFGPDGFLYITSGDGTSDSDIWDAGQRLDDLLGGVLRIDVNRPDPNGERPYSIPPDNPFLGLPNARPEFWAYGLRNPWRMGIDLESGQIWVGNNGQDHWETAHLVGRGENYGWSVYEGNHPFYLNRKRGPTPIVAPTIEHSHAEFRSLTGGVVYRGDRFPELEGAYIYGDYSTGRIWAMKHDGQKPLWHRELANTTLQIASFRVDRQGNLLITDHGGGFSRLVAAPEPEPTAPFPSLLSETGLFTSILEHQPDPALIPYSINAQGWNDGAEAERFLAIPGEETVGFQAIRNWDFPDGTALVQTLFLERLPGQAASRFRVETRVLLLQSGEWAGYSYRWNDDQSDAKLVEKGGADVVFPIGKGQGEEQTWRFPSRAECLTCHSRAAGFVLGVTGAQLNREHDYGNVQANQLSTLDHIGLFTNPLPKPPEELEQLCNPWDDSADLEERARAYLHVNCSSCHIQAGGGNSQIELGFSTPREKMKLIEARPQHDTFGIPNAMLVAPGDPDRSVLIHRISQRERGQMPPLVSHRVDERAVSLLREWIAGLEPARPFVKNWTMADLLPMLGQIEPERSVEPGRQLFLEIGCAECHRFEGEGGTVGPDLDGLATRLSPEEVLESILEPAKVVADEYANVLIATDDGAIYSGQIENENEQFLILRPTPPAEVISIPKSEIVERQQMAGSNMPDGIINVLEAKEILDLLGYLLSASRIENSKP